MSVEVSAFLPLRTPPPSVAGSIRHGLSSGFEALRAHKLRAGLTVLGTALGIAAVVAIGGIGQLTQAAVERQFGDLGATLISVQAEPPPPPPGSEGGRVTVGGDFNAPGPAQGVTTSGSGPVQSGGGGPPGGGANPKFGLAEELTDADAAALRALPHVVAASPHVAGAPLQIVAGEQNRQARVFGVLPDIQRILGYRLQAGTFFTDQDVSSGATVAVLDAAVARDLGSPQTLVGQSVRIGSVDFTVVGVLDEHGRNENEVEAAAFVPYSVIDRLRGNGRLFAIGGSALSNTGVLVQVDSVANISQVESAISETLNRLHPPRGDRFPYVSHDFKQALDAQVTATRGVSLAMTGVAVIALAIGALGLLSVMTVSVAERTREIGMRLAVGARRSDVLFQFLGEAAAIALCGGVLGIAIGSATTPLLARVHPAFGGLVVAPSVAWVLAALVVALVIGLTFGYLPARRAARMDPVAALRRG